MHRLFIFFQYELTKICQDISNQRAPVGRWGHQDEVGEHLSHFRRDFRKIGVLGFQVTFQQVVNLTVNAVGHFSSFDPNRQRWTSILFVSWSSVTEAPLPL